jgi:hypothetical protein
LKGKSKELNPPIPSRTDYNNGAAQIAFRVDGMISVSIFTLTSTLIFACSCYSRSCCGSQSSNRTSTSVHTPRLH